MIERKEIEHLAKLSHISFSEEELGGFATDIGSILEYVDQLKEISDVDTGVPSVGAVHNILREDGNSYVGGESRDEIINSFPEKEGDYLKVKKIL